MSEPVGPIGAFSIACGSGTFSVSVLCAIGLDPSHLIAGLVACVIVQMFIEPNSYRSVASIVRWTIGSVLFAGLFTPVVAPWAIERVIAFVPKASAPAIILLTAATLAAVAQPLVGLMHKTLLPDLVARLRKFIGPSGGNRDG